MSARHRAIAGAPERTASATAALIAEMVTDTLAPASVDQTDVAAEIGQLAPTLRMLVAGKHLRDAPVVLCADPLRVDITVVTGDQAESLDENLGKVPGAATATGWSLHLPNPAALGGWVHDAAAGSEHITTSPPSKQASTEAAFRAIDGGDVDLDVLKETADG